jgi:hypothetical protein
LLFYRTLTSDKKNSDFDGEATEIAQSIFRGRFAENLLDSQAGALVNTVSVLTVLGTTIGLRR